MESLFTLNNLMTLGMLILLQAVLGFDNLLYISLESKRAPAEKQAMVRRLGIGIAVALRIVLLFVLMQLIHYFRDPLFSINVWQWLEGTFNLHSLIVLAGGVFIMYTATREILHMMELEEAGQEERKPTAAGTVIFYIVAIIIFKRARSIHDCNFYFNIIHINI